MACALDVPRTRPICHSLVCSNCGAGAGVPRAGRPYPQDRPACLPDRVGAGQERTVEGTRRLACPRERRLARRRRLDASRRPGAGGRRGLPARTAGTHGLLTKTLVDLGVISRIRRGAGLRY
jgi:hypothetical protein